MSLLIPVSLAYAVPSVTIDSVSDTTPIWDIDTVTISGSATETSTGDTVEIDWGDGTTTSGVDASTGSWGPVDHVYGSSDVGSNDITVTLFLGGTTPDDTDSTSIDVQKHATSLTIGNQGNVPWGQPISASGVLTDIDAGVVLTGKSITFSGSGVGTIASTNTIGGGAYSSSGTAPGAPAATGLTIVADYAGDASYESDTSPTDSYDTLIHPTSLTIGNQGNVFWSTSVSASGILTDTVLSAGISGESITFSGSGVGTIASTNTIGGGAYSSSGTAPGAPAATGLTIVADYAGSTGFYDSSSSSTDTYDTLKHTTSLSISDQGNVFWGGSISSSGSLDDTVSGFAGGISGKSITFTTSLGTILPSTSTGITGSYSSSGTAPGAPAAIGKQITANFAGDSSYEPATSPTDSYDTLIHPVTLTITPAIVDVYWGQAVSVAGTLVDDVTSAGIAGSITFSGTGADGITVDIPDATSSVAGTFSSTGTSSGAPAVTGYVVDANYAGVASTYTTASDSDTYDTLIHPTTLTISPAIADPYWGEAVTVAGTLKDDVTGNGVVGTIAFSGDGADGITVGIPDVSTTSGTGAYTSTGTSTGAPAATGYDVTADYAGLTDTFTTASASDVYDTIVHPTTVNLNVIESPFANNKFFVAGTFVDDRNGLGVAQRIVEFDGSGAPADLGDATTNGVEVSDTAGIVINSCLSCPIADNIMRLNTGAQIITPSNPVYVSLYLTDMGTNTVSVSVTNAEVPPTITVQTAKAQGSDTGLFTLTDPLGIARVTIVSVSGGGTAGISKINTAGAELGTIHNIDFTTQTITPQTTMKFDNGRFYSEGTSQGTPATNLLVDAHFDGDSSYAASVSEVLPVSNQQVYSVFPSTTFGLGGTASVTADANTGIVSVLCSTDTDNDALCDSWESTGAGSGPGIPFTVSGTQFYYPLPLSNTASKDIFVEIDAMVSHTPDATALANVAAAFSAKSINLRHTVNDITLTHLDTITLWKDSDTVDNNDFNSLKNDFFGTASERPVLNSQAAQVNSVAPTTASTTPTITLSGITISVPSNTITLGKTEGTITAQIKVTTKSGATLTTTTITPGVIATPASPAGLTLGTITASTVTTGVGVKTLTVKIPFTTTGPIGTTTIPTITIPLTLGSSLITTVSTNPGSPSISTTLLNAKSQGYRYGIWGHSFGGPSGQSEVRGNDFIISLGAGFGGSLTGHTGSIGTTQEQAGTYMHELGHILNLEHGGPKYLLSAPATTLADSTINCKPNHLSIMSYSRQLPTYLGAAWLLDYSSGGRSPLTETALAEYTGLAGPVGTIVWGTPTTASSHVTPHSFHTSASNAASIDWNDSGSITGSPTTVTADINNFGISGCGATTPTATPYNDYNEWANLDFNFRQGPSGQFDGTPSFVSEDTANGRYQQILQTGKFTGTDSPVSQVGAETANAGSAVPIKLQIKNQAGQAVDIPTAVAKVFVSTNINTGYVQIKDHSTGGDMQWDPANKQLKLVWKTKSSDKGKTFFIRIFLSDPQGVVTTGLADGFLKDTTAPFMPSGQNLLATNKVKLT